MKPHNDCRRTPKTPEQSGVYPLEHSAHQGSKQQLSVDQLEYVSAAAASFITDSARFDAYKGFKFRLK